MRLLLAADIFPPESGGPATYAVQLANGLVAQGTAVTIVSLNPASDKSVLDTRVNFDCVTTRFKPVRYWQYYRLLLKHGPTSDVIYAMGPVNAGLFAMKAAKKLGKKFVVKVVGDYAWEQGQVRGLVRDSIDEFQTKKYGGKIGRLQKIEREVVCNADCVIVPSKYLAGIVKEWGAEEKKNKVIYNAMKFQVVDPVVKPAHERWIVSVGRLVSWKGMLGLIEVMPQIIKEFPDVKLKIIGDGPEWETLQKYIANMHVESVVELRGNVSHRESLAYIHAADLFVLNSAYEGLSHVILEALSFNKPVLASSSGGNSEIVIPGKTGKLFQYNDKETIVEYIIDFLKIGISPDWQGVDRDIFFKRFESVSMTEETKKVLESV